MSIETSLQDDSLNDEMFSPEELAMMAGAAGKPTAPPTVEDQMADLQTQIQGLAAFIAEGVQREQGLRAKVHALDAELRKTEGMRNVAASMSDLHAHVETMGQHTARALAHERAIRDLLKGFWQAPGGTRGRRRLT